MSVLENGPCVIAHRGASAYEPENTLPAFEKALKLGCKYIEFDVMLSKDDQLYVFHDSALQRRTNGKGLFADTLSNDIDRLNAGKGFKKPPKEASIPKLETLLRWMQKHGVQANLEMKPSPTNIEKTVVETLGVLNRVVAAQTPWPLISSFEFKALEYCRSLSPEARLGLLMHGWEDNWESKASELDCFSIHLATRIATKDRIASIKDKGFKVYVYTVNRKKTARKLFNYGVDCVFSDYPDLMD